MPQLNPPAETSPLWRLTAATLCTGVLAGLGGMLLALLLHFIQHLAFGYSPDFIISNESFLQGVSEATRSRRLAVLVLCGAVAGFGWWALYRWGKPLVSIAAAVKSDQPRMPLVSTTLHALLQIITVALGSPLGREVAPREIGAVSASWLAGRFSLTVRETQIMIACGAGAGQAPGWRRCITCRWVARCLYLKCCSARSAGGCCYRLSRLPPLRRWWRGSGLAMNRSII